MRSEILKKEFIFPRHSGNPADQNTLIEECFLYWKIFVGIHINCNPGIVPKLINLIYYDNRKI